MYKQKIENLAKKIKFGLVIPTKNSTICASFGSLAQLVEQLAFNQLVGRSSRPRPTIYLKLKSLDKDWWFISSELSLNASLASCASIIIKPVWVVSSVGRAVGF